MAVTPPWAPEAQVGPASLGPQPLGNVPTPFGNVNNRGGMFGGIAGTLASAAIPGAGLVGSALGTGFDVRAANNQLSSLGLDRSVAFGPSFANNMSFGLAGRSPRDQFNQAVTQAYPGLLQALTPAPPVQGQPGAYEGTPSQGYFDGINDYNNVGRLGEVLDSRGVPGGYQGGGGGAGTNGGATSEHDGYGGGGGGYDGPGAQSDAFRKGGIVPHDGDSRLEARRVTAHEGEGIVRPEAMQQIGARNFHDINKGGPAMRQAMARILKAGA